MKYLQLINIALTFMMFISLSFTSSAKIRNTATKIMNPETPNPNCIKPEKFDFVTFIINTYQSATTDFISDVVSLTRKSVLKIEELTKECTEKIQNQFNTIVKEITEKDNIAAKVNLSKLNLKLNILNIAWLTAADKENLKLNINNPKKTCKILVEIVRQTNNKNDRFREKAEKGKMYIRNLFARINMRKQEILEGKRKPEESKNHFAFVEKYLKSIENEQIIHSKTKLFILEILKSMPDYETKFWQYLEEIQQNFDYSSGAADENLADMKNVMKDLPKCNELPSDEQGFDECAKVRFATNALAVYKLIKSVPKIENKVSFQDQNGKTEHNPSTKTKSNLKHNRHYKSENNQNASTKEDNAIFNKKSTEPFIHEVKTEFSQCNFTPADTVHFINSDNFKNLIYTPQKFLNICEDLMQNFRIHIPSVLSSGPRMIPSRYNTDYYVN